MRDILGHDFFGRPAAAVARELIGMHLVVRDGERGRAYLITEAEAYHGSKDKASHARRGRTERNAPMFGPPGHWYVYLIYGMYWMLNVVTGKEGQPSAVLIRGIEGSEGPGKLTRALGIDRRFNASAASRKTGLWLEDRGVRVPRSRVGRGPRIGVAYAGEWADKPLRFFLTRSI
jgi:DNA-3-methyladenine glycosylase